MADEDMKPDEIEENIVPEETTQADSDAQPVEETQMLILDDDKAKSVQPRTIEDEMEESYLQYSMSVIVSRALPDVRDGLKPVQRRILYVMNEAGLRSTAKFRKSATVVGDVMGSYHPHGDSSIYDTMVRMAQPWSMRYEMVDGQGNFGSMDGDPPAAYRYTEARMTKQAEQMLTDIEKETVPFRPNFDDSKQEPSVLPAKLPNLLLNGQVGIAVGMATNIPPHNLGELVDATVELIDNENATTDDLLKHVQGPDFPTGGIIYGKESLRTAYTTGRGGIIMRAVANIEENPAKKDGHRIVVTEVPYALNKSTLIEKIADLVRNKKINGISDLRDESARGDVKIVIDLKKDAYPKKILNQLFKMTPLQTSYHFNMLALIDGIQPRVLGLHTILTEYLKHRQLVVRKRTEYELRKAEARAHILEGLKIALDNIDAIIATIRASATTDEAQENLMKKFKLSELQAKAILAMQLRALAGLERKKVEDELAELIKLIKELKAILADEKRILAIIRDELLEMKESFGDERRTKVVVHELGKFSEEELIPNEQVVVTITAGNYIKRSLSDDYKKQGRGGKGRRGMITKEEDIIEHLVLANTHDYLLFFTNKGRLFRLKAYEVPQVGLAAKGQAIVNLLQLQPEERVSSIVNLSQQGSEGYLFMVTKMGTVKKTALDDYKNVRQSGLIAIRLDETDELKWIMTTTGDEDIIIATRKGQAIRFSEKDVRPMGRVARGVRGIRLRAGDSVVGAGIAAEDSNIFVVSDNGYGKRTKVAQFTTHKRGGVGIRAAVVNKKTGDLVAMRSLRDMAEEILLISEKGQTIRTGLKEISEISRTTQGVRIMKLNDNDVVASVALILKAPGEEDAEAGDDTEEAQAALPIEDVIKPKK
jgi:DNA gyrase subunit A